MRAITKQHLRKIIEEAISDELGKSGPPVATQIAKRISQTALREIEEAMFDELPFMPDAEAPVIRRAIIDQVIEFLKTSSRI